MVTFILVVIVIGILILVHEWGHFYSARKLGVKVEEFGFGFPPRLFSKVKNGVRYSLNAFPFGGFVKIFGEHGEGEESPQSFASRPARQRFLILAAGVIMNAILAWIFFSISAGMGVPQVSGEIEAGTPVSIISVLPGSPAERAGLRLGDKIFEMRSGEISLRIEKEDDVRDFVEAYRGEKIILAVGRGKEILEIQAEPRFVHPEGEGPLGIALGRLSVKRVPFYLAPLEGTRIFFRTVTLTVAGLAGIIRDLAMEGTVKAAVSGPVGIFFFAGDASSLGPAFFLQFMGILSVNLAILNFLPIPALDGGRILFLAIEKIRRRRVDPKVENIVHALGFALLILLMVLVTYRDVARIF